MKAATKRRTRVERLDEGDWLHRLLADVQQQVATHPSPGAVERIRQRLLAETEAPTKVAA